MRERESKREGNGIPSRQGVNMPPPTTMPPTPAMMILIGMVSVYSTAWTGWTVEPSAATEGHQARTHDRRQHERREILQCAKLPIK